MAIPESIKQKANKIRNEVYGKDVREALASGIEEAGDIADQANTKSNDAVEQVDNIQAQVNQLVVEGDSSVEAAQARVDAEGKSYPTLKARLDAKETQFSSQLAQSPNGSKGSWSVWTEFEKRVVNVEWFADLVVDNDWTSAFQAAINTTKRKVLLPPLDGPIKLGRLFIDKDLEIDLAGNELIITDGTIFCVTKDLDYLEIYGCGGVEVEGYAAMQISGDHFFTNYKRLGEYGDNRLSFPQGKNIEQYSIKKLIIRDNELNYSKVAIMGDDTVPVVKGNTWEHDEGISAAPYYLYIYKGWQGANPEFKSNLWVKDNIFKVYPPDGLNKDIIKVSAGVKNGKIIGNHIENKNLNCEAQVDVFTGGHRMKFLNNSLINVQYHRKQSGGEHIFETNPSRYGFDIIMGNDTEIEEGSIIHTPYYLMGSLFTVAFNQIEFRNKISNKKYGFYIARNPELLGRFNKEQSLAFIINSNIVDFGEEQGVFVDTLPSRNQDGLGEVYPESVSLSNNIMAGGTEFLGGFLEQSAVLGNIWVDSERGERFINLRNNGIAIGNVADTVSSSHRVNARTEGNSNNASVYWTVVNNEIDVRNKKLIVPLPEEGSSGSYISRILNGYEGQEITLVQTSNNWTFRVDAREQIRLNGDYQSVRRGSSLSLIKIGDHWYETSRVIVE